MTNESKEIMQTWVLIAVLILTLIVLSTGLGILGGAIAKKYGIWAAKQDAFIAIEKAKGDVEVSRIIDNKFSPVGKL